MATVTRTTTWNDNDILTATALNNEFNNLLNAVAIVNADISASAAIAYSKLSLTGSIVNADISASAAIAASKISDTAVTLTATQTMTNKTLTTPTVTKPIMDARNPSAQTYTPSAAGTATLDLSLADEHRITMPAGNITIALSNDTNAQKFVVSITQDSVGSRTVTWFTTIKWAGGSAPVLTTTANKRDTFGFIRTGSGTYDGFVVGTNI